MIVGPLFIAACTCTCASNLWVQSRTALRELDLLLTTLRTRAGAFLPRLLVDTGLLETSDETAEGRKKSNKEMLDLNVILVYKKLVQGLIYSPPDSDKYLALDAELQV